MAAINKNGGAINVNDRVSITAKVVSYTSAGAIAAVTVQAPLDAGTFVIQANDCFAVEQQSDALHTARSLTGNPFGVAGDDITILGLVTAIAGSGINAKLTVTLITSQASITTAAGNTTSDNV